MSKSRSERWAGIFVVALGVVALTACEPGACVRESDCAGELFCHLGRCTAPPVDAQVADSSAPDAQRVDAARDPDAGDAGADADTDTDSAALDAGTDGGEADSATDDAA